MEIAKRQKALTQELSQALHDKNSEKLSEDERQLVFEDLEAAIPEVEAARGTSPAMQRASARKRAIAKRNIGNLQDHLHWIAEIIEPEGPDCPCGRGLPWSFGPMARTMAAAQDRRRLLRTAEYPPNIAPRDRVSAP